MTTHEIREAVDADAPRIEAIAVAAKMFTSEEASFLGDMLRTAGDEASAEARWLVLEQDDAGIVGAAYYAPEPFADRMWNLYFIAIDPRSHGRGLGQKMMRHIEQELRARGSEAARTLIVETSSTEQYARTREFYRRLGYDEEARVRQFYGPEDDKIVFWKSLVA